MKYTKEQIIAISKQILKDFGREFFEDSIKVNTPEKVNEWWGNDLNFEKVNTPEKVNEWWGNDLNFEYDVWEIFIGVPNEQFGSTGVFSIYFKDETMEPFMFHDGGAPGRTPNLEIIKKNGKYVIGDEWKG